LIHAIHPHLALILRTKDRMIFAGVQNVVIALESSFSAQAF